MGDEVAGIGQHCPPLRLVVPGELVDQGPEPGLDLGLQRLVTFFAGELVQREVRSGRVEVTQMWGRPESVRQEFRKRRVQ